MPYTNLLKKVINDTNYTNVEISEKCKELGINVDRSYINKLFNGKAQPPKEEISRAIAKVCNADERLLVLEGYIDKAPKEILEFLKHLQYLTNLTSLKVFENEFGDNKELLNQYKSALDKEPIADFILDILNNKDMDILLNNTFNLPEATNLSASDNAMYPLIPNKTHIHLTLKNKYDNGDIIAFKIKNQEKLHIRYLFFNDNKYMLTALNQDFKPIFCNEKDITIIGKVSKVTYDIS